MILCVSNWDAVIEMIAHGFTRDEKYAAEEGDFNLWVDPNAASGLKKSVYLKE